MMPTVDLIYDGDCPNVVDARSALMRAFSMLEMKAEWREWNSADPDAPARVRGYGSPTILVDGRDVAGVAPIEGVSCCRLYEGDDGNLRGVPSVAVIAAALEEASAASPPASEKKANAGKALWRWPRPSEWPCYPSSPARRVGLPTPA